MGNKRPTKYLQGVYRPRHPEKYKGNINDIIYRSSYELQFMHYCDSNPSIIHWGSEEVVIPYLKPTDNRIHKYYLDFWIEYISNEYEQQDDYWEEIIESNYTEDQKIQIQLIKEGKHPKIKPIINIVKIPNNEIGKVNDIYLSETTGVLFIKKQGKYVTDKNGERIGKIKKAIIEIKPHIQTERPKKQSRITESYKKKCITYSINNAKWDAAEQFATKHNMEFIIITEKWLKNIK